MTKIKVFARAVVVSFVAGGLLLTGLPASFAAATPEPGPVLQTPTAQLFSALKCSADLAPPNKTPVLLVPGFGESVNDAYSGGYEKYFRDQGRPLCLLTIPGRGFGDMQVTVEYVVSAIRSMNEKSGEKISAIGHSEGGMLLTWAVKFWPDLATRLDDVINIASPINGTSFTGIIPTCKPNEWYSSCPPVGFQVSRGSDWTTALAARRLPGDFHTRRSPPTMMSSFFLRLARPTWLVPATSSCRISVQAELHCILAY
ncbi:esterase/lipase family protein [Renibacterium salmoninarum]|nr:hypothetical protein [Renibacterium salmoninarum]